MTKIIHPFQRPITQRLSFFVNLDEKHETVIYYKVEGGKMSHSKS